MFFLLRALFWLVTLPVRLALFVVALVFWVLTLPVRIVFGTLALIGFARLLQFALIGAIGYAAYRLANPSDEAVPPLDR